MDCLFLNPDCGAGVESVGELVAEKILPNFCDNVLIVGTQDKSVIRNYLDEYENCVDFVFVNDREDFVDVAGHPDKWLFLLHGRKLPPGLSRVANLLHYFSPNPFVYSVRYFPGYYTPEPREKDIDVLIVSRVEKIFDFEFNLLNELSLDNKVVTILDSDEFSDSVEVIGTILSRKELFNLYTRSKYVFLPHQEAVPLVIPEALHCGSVPFIPFIEKSNHLFPGVYLPFCSFDFGSKPLFEFDRSFLPSFESMLFDILSFVRGMGFSAFLKEPGRIEYLLESDKPRMKYTNDVF